jgi:murein DD-endopeptidase MepM/ murein hydrolase activator NlpD
MNQSYTVIKKFRISISLLLLVLTLITFSNTNQAMEHEQIISTTNSCSLYVESSDEANHNIYLYMDLNEYIVEVTLFYYNLSYIPKEYEISKKVSNGSISFLIPENHTGMPGIEYYFMLLTKDGHQIITSTYSEVFDISPYFDDYEDISIRSTGSVQMWWDIEFRGGVTPCGKNISNRRQTAKLPFRNLTPAVTSKSMEIRNISGSNFHRGIDFGAPKGTPVYHIFDSSVVRRIQDDGSSEYGKYVMVEFERGTTVYYVLYAHLDRFHPDLRVGQSIGSNTIIGYVGNTGNSTGDHLHL